MRKGRYLTDASVFLRLIALASVVFMFFLADATTHAANWKVIYSEEFTADPGWTTDQPTNFYWESGTGTYFIHETNNAEAYEPDRYAMKLITPYSGGSFKLEWDLEMLRSDWSAGINFGMFDAQFCYMDKTGTANIGIEYVNPDPGYEFDIRMHQDLNEAISNNWTRFELNVWYHNVLVYDSQARTVQWTVYGRGESTPFMVNTLTNAPIITNDIKYLGSTRYPLGHPNNGGYDTNGVAEARIDNVVLSVEDPFCKGNFDYDLDVDGTDAARFKQNFGRKNCPADGPAPVERTWQTTAYADYDDGYYQKGVAHPTPRFTDNGNGTVTDNLTGLIWLKNANCFGIRTWEQAISDCNGLNSGECGLTDGSIAGDWRLPNMKELLSLIDYGYITPALPNAAGTGHWTSGDPFTNVQSNCYWSSSTNVSNSNVAHYVDVNGGGVSGFDKPESSGYVWPVRGGH